MLERFSGQDGNGRLFTALGAQSIIGQDYELARAVVEVAELQEIASGTILISQAGVDNDFFLVLAGRLSVEVNGLEIALRESALTLGRCLPLIPLLREARQFGL